MPTSNNNRTAERLPPRPLASNDNHLSSPSVQQYNNNYYTPRVNSPHSHPPHHEFMRDQSLSLHPYSGRDSDSYRLMTPMSANNNKTKSSSISLNHSNNNSVIIVTIIIIIVIVVLLIILPRRYHPLNPTIYTIRDTKGHHLQIPPTPLITQRNV